MNYYENIAILDAALDDAAIEAAEKKILDVIEKSSGEVLKKERWGRKKLAYTINKRDKGFYIFIAFKSPPAAVKALESFYKVYDAVFKFMVIKLEKKEIHALEETLKSKQPKEEAAAETEPKTE
ncbi:30S ribosomal protein S6 [Candidatus Magnetomonas plexicatena]|uniref:30S ribosomal protein S6 n=1 Tax=Candidatus Magnetomonas plexicatena TaxID=2552947 RepID=UPI001C76095E|nr:30S ribosomal protein S6 [Nitrospirales bacterium LBB_01]